MAQKKITELQQISAMTDGSSFPVDNGIQTYRATGSQLKTYLAPLYIPDSYEELLSGTGTWNKHYAFVAVGASATVGATYTHNSVTYTVKHTVASGNIVYLSGSAAPLASGTLTKSAGTGDASIVFSEVRAPIQLYVEMVGGGGGGAGSGTASSSSNGANGAASTFGSSLLTCNLGTGANWGSSQPAGGTATIAAPAYGQTQTGGGGGGYQYDKTYLSGGMGGVSMLGGNGSQGGASSNGGNAATNSGSGGGGGGGGATGAGFYTGSSGAAGGGLKATIPSPSATYAYAVGAGGAGGSAGTSGFTGGNGAAGKISIWCKYQ